MKDLEKAPKREDREFQKTQNLLIAKVKDVLKTSSGQALIWEILSMCGIYSSTFTGNSQGAYLEGRRSIGLEILQLLEDADKTFYPKLLLEKQDTI